MSAKIRRVDCDGRKWLLWHLRECQDGLATDPELEALGSEPVTVVATADLDALLAVAEAARELMSWDWQHHLADGRHGDDARSDAATLGAALARLTGGER